MVSFRKLQTTSGKTVLGGKSAENNEKLIEQAEPEETVLPEVV
jgi:predicted ribosome quality control (RQC) complex YloA/Tae2 family protein